MKIYKPNRKYVFEEYKKLQPFIKAVAPKKKPSSRDFDALGRQLSQYSRIKLQYDKDKSLTCLSAIEDCGMSKRLYRILVVQCDLFRYDYGGKMPILKLQNLSKKEFLSYRQVGKEALKELEAVCRRFKVKMLP